MKKRTIGIFYLMLTFSLILFLSGSSLFASRELSKETKTCLECHEDDDPGIVLPWKESEMGKAGVGCYECHKAEKGDKDAMNHNDFPEK
ncbi:MAG: hypothetical protein ABFR75_05000 [Acidobacteriota bacterium]